ncbi:MAG: hypothetical protein ACK5OC_27670, partial [Pirellula sp.]
GMAKWRSTTLKRSPNYCWRLNVLICETDSLLLIVNWLKETASPPFVYWTRNGFGSSRVFRSTLRGIVS